ncbi:MAG: GNAT family N-acetyltransferase [Anaerolineae bacterium]
MREYIVVEMLPTPSEYNYLRASVGWGTYESDVIASSLPRSLFCVCAVLDEKIVGMARVIGDGGLVYYIQDVIVLPEHQRNGIGTRMMDAVISYLRAHVSPNSVIGLMSAKGKESFYSRYGFITRPTEQFGCGMTAKKTTIHHRIF